MYKVLFISLVTLLTSHVFARQMDPTRPFGKEITVSTKQDGKVKQGLSLQAIIHSAGKKSVVVDGHSLTVGDKYGYYEIVSINVDSVVIRSPQGIQELFLFSEVTVNL